MKGFRVSQSETCVCPAALSGGLDNRIRRLVQNPRKILAPYIKEGMNVLDIGCGPGFFTIDMAALVGKNGHVVAADLQHAMLEKVAQKIKGTDLEKIITLHRCEQDKIGLSESFDFIFAFYMVHEVPDQLKFCTEIASLLKPDGQFFIIEPPFHVTKKAFVKTIEKAREAGLKPVREPVMWFDKSVLLQKEVSSLTREELEKISRQWISLWTAPVDWRLYDALHSDGFIDGSPAGRTANKKGFAAALTEFTEAFPDLATRILDMVIDTTQAKVSIRWAATGTNVKKYLGLGPTHRKTTFRGIEIIEILEGKIHQRWGEWDAGEHYE